VTRRTTLYIQAALSGDKKLRRAGSDRRLWGGELNHRLHRFHRGRKAFAAGADRRKAPELGAHPGEVGDRLYVLLNILRCQLRQLSVPQLGRGRPSALKVFVLARKIAVFLSATMTAGIFVSGNRTLPLCAKVCRLVPLICEDRRIGSRDSIGSGQRQRNPSRTNSREADTNHWLVGFFCGAQPFRRACVVGISLDTPR
jgi:hypothetical protein